MTINDITIPTRNEIKILEVVFFESEINWSYHLEYGKTNVIKKIKRNEDDRPYHVGGGEMNLYRLIETPQATRWIHNGLRSNSLNFEQVSSSRNNQKAHSTRVEDQH